MSSVSKGMPPMKPETFASAFIFADKAKAEGVDQKPETRLQLKLARYGILYQQMDTKLEEETKYSDDEVKKYYDSHKGTGELDQIHVQHILFATVAMPSPADPTGGKPDAEAKKKTAEDVLQRVKNGEDFGELAKQYSDDPGSKEKGGDLGWSPRFKFVPEFEEAAWKLQPGQVSELVKTDYGYHIIKVLERKPPEDLTPQTTEELKDALSQRRFEQAMNDIAERNRVRLPDDFAVAAPSPAELNPMIPGMQAPMPGDEEMDESDAGPPPAPEPSTSKSEAKKPAAKAATPAKKGTK
jgi:parvulin-like peptidyl-prolyl isomerase